MGLCVKTVQTGVIRKSEGFFVFASGSFFFNRTIDKYFDHLVRIKIDFGEGRNAENFIPSSAQLYRTIAVRSRVLFRGTLRNGSVSVLYIAAQ